MQHASLQKISENETKEKIRRKEKIQNYLYYFKLYAIGKE